MKFFRIAVLEILALPERRAAHLLYHLLLTKQFASVMPQAVAVWCRQAGCDVHYATYYGIGDPLRAIPPDCDLVFLSCYTQASPLAYAISKILRRRGIATVLGGPHAKAFPLDAARFFDYVVGGECDRDLVLQLVKGDRAPGIVAARAPPRELPLVEERLSEIARAGMFFGRWRSPITTVALLSSLGCPYACSFCIDWKSKYQIMPADRLIADLRFIAARMPRALVAFHDPNFAVKFDETLETLELQEPGRRLPYVMESSLSILKPARMARLAATNCIFVAPGVESWEDFSNKSNGGAKRGRDKLESVVAQFTQLNAYVPNLQANFIFGLDTDCGAEPLALLKLFMDETPFVWPTLNIPVPFGGTPLFDELRRDGRILEAMPFAFYYAPYSVTKILHYDPRDYYRGLIGLFEHLTSPDMIRRRIATRRRPAEKAVELARLRSTRREIDSYRRILRRLCEDSHLLAFHQGKSSVLPQFYRAEYAAIMGRYWSLLDEEDCAPVLHQPAESSAVAQELPRAAVLVQA